MKKLVIALCAFGLAGCSETTRVLDKPVLYERAELVVPSVAPVSQGNVTWTIITPENYEAKAKEIEANFQRRMSLLDEEFDLTDEDRSIIAEDLNAIVNDEQFEKWYKKFSTFAAAKKKSAKKFVLFKKEGEEKDDKEMKEEKASEVVANEEKTVEEVISSAEVTEEVLPNASSPQEASLVEKISAAFNKNSVKINK